MIMNEKSKLVSVIVPVFNVFEYLSKCVESVLKQTYQNFELILIDDGSNDGSSDVCDRYGAIDSRIRVYHKKNGGVSSARNIGLKNALGEYVVFVDADDYIDSCYISTLVSGAQCYDVDFVRVPFLRNGHSYGVSEDYIRNGERVVSIFHLTNLKPFAYAGGILIKKECLVNVFFDETIHYGEDKLFLVSACMNSKSKSILLIDKPLYVYVDRPCSSSSSFFNKRMLTIVDAALKIENLLKDDEKLHALALDNKRDFYFLLFYKLYGSSEKKNYSECLSYLKKELKSLRKKYRPLNRNGNIVELAYLNGFGKIISPIISFKRRLKLLISNFGTR